MQINLFTVSLLKDVVTVKVYPQKKEKAHTASVYSEDCPLLWSTHRELGSDQPLYYPLDNESDCFSQPYTANVQLTQSVGFAKKYIKQQLHLYFNTVAYAVGYDKVGNLEVWVPAPNQPYGQAATTYDRFAIMPQYDIVVNGISLRISYSGRATVHNKSVLEAPPREEHFTVISRKRILSYSHFTQLQDGNPAEAFPHLSKPLFKEFKIKEEWWRPNNRYISDTGKIIDFVRGYMTTEAFKSSIGTIPEYFLDVPESNVGILPEFSNIVQFGNQNYYSTQQFFTNFDAGMKQFGPFSSATGKPVQLLLIVQKSDASIAEAFVKAAEQQLGFFPGISNYIKVPFHKNAFGKTEAILFTGPDTAYQEIKNSIASKIDRGRLNFDQYKYLAIYFSPIRRDDTTSIHHQLYYQIKELLLSHGIPSQVIFKTKPTESAFRYHLANIASAVLAKLGGVPWALPPTQNNEGDLVVGVGAFKSSLIGERYIGSAFSFDENGVFRNCDCYKEDRIDKLASSISTAIGYFVVDRQTKQQRELKRLVIHFYKEMSDRDAGEILKLIYALNYRIPMIVVHIGKTETSDYIGFNPDAADLMPLSGSYLKLTDNQYLLYNSGKYDEEFHTRAKSKDYLFPIRVRMSHIDRDENGNKMPITDQEAVDMLNILHRFSRIYWRSVSYQNLPVTTAYPEMVAQIVPFFKDKILPQFAKETPWFL